MSYVSFSTLHPEFSLTHSSQCLWLELGRTLLTGSIQQLFWINKNLKKSTEDDHNPSLHSHSIWEICHNFSCSVVWSLYSSEGLARTRETQHNKSRKDQPLLWTGTDSSSGSCVVCLPFIYHCLSKKQKSSRGFKKSCSSAGSEETVLSTL